MEASRQFIEIHLKEFYETAQLITFIQSKLYKLSAL